MRSAARPPARQRALCAGLGCRGSGVPAGTPAAAALMPAVVSSNGARLRSLIKQCLAGCIAMRLGAMRRAHASMGACWAAAGRRSAGAAGEAAAGADARERLAQQLESARPRRLQLEYRGCCSILGGMGPILVASDHEQEDDQQQVPSAGSMHADGGAAWVQRARLGGRPLHCFRRALIAGWPRVSMQQAHSGCSGVAGGWLAAGSWAGAE